MANTKLINCDQLQVSLTRVKAYIDGGFSVNTHNHHLDYYTKNEINSKIDAINSVINNKANSSHSHGGTDVVMTGYAKPNSTSAITTGDTLNVALGKIEKALDNKSDISHNHNNTYLGINATAKSADKLATVRQINGVNFDGTANITITANPNAHTQASNTINSMAGYTIATESSAIATSDTLNAAIGKLEFKINKKQDGGSYAPSVHNHDDRYYTESEINTKITDLKAADTNNLKTAKDYTDSKVAELVDTAPEALDTLKELADALGDDPNFASTVATNIGNKADKNHSHVNATTSAAGFMTADMVNKLNGIANNANNYVHPTTAGNKHIPSGGSPGQFLGWSADGTAKWVGNPNTDNKVNVAADTASETLYLTAATGAGTGGLKYNSGVKLNAKTGAITATTFKGALEGNASSATTAAACSGNAATANKVNHTLTLQFNGTTSKTFNGSSDQTFNVTCAAIGAATTADAAKATDEEVTAMLDTLFGAAS